MANSVSLGEKYAGMYRWESEPDHEGDILRITNTRDGRLVVGVGNDKKGFRNVLISSEDSWSMVTSAMALRDGEFPALDKESQE